MNPFPELVIILILCALCFSVGYFIRKVDYEAGYIAGQNEERSYANSRIIQAKLHAWQGGVHFGYELRDALMSRRLGNVSGRPAAILTKKTTSN